jgi:hypothetical protein
MIGRPEKDKIKKIKKKGGNMKRCLGVLFCVLVLTLGLAAGAKKTGLFPVCYEIGGDKPGAPLFKVSLLVYTPGKTVSGYGIITQATNPPLKIETKLNGDFTYMTVMPRIVHILVVATGYPDIHWPPHGGIGPVIPPKVHLRMVLKENWKSGTANYQYLDSKGNWHNIKNAPVKIVDCWPK